jgi:hypothetical protein
MKKTVITTIAALSITAGAFAQGSITFEGGTTVDYVSAYSGNRAVDTSPTSSSTVSYAGAFNTQIWFENSTTDVASQTTINTLDGTSGGGAAILAFLQGNSNFSLQASVNLNISPQALGGFAAPSTVNLPTVPTGVNGLFVVYATDGAGLAGGLAGFGNTGGNPFAAQPGIPADYEPTFDQPNQNLVMSPTPEPSTIALGGLGAASLLLFRRRK